MLITYYPIQVLSLNYIKFVMHQVEIVVKKKKKKHLMSSKIEKCHMLQPPKPYPTDQF